jgi:prevent-host-death family protein
VKTVTVEDFRDHPDRYLAEAAQGDVVLTQDGVPWMVLRSVEHDQDRLSAACADSPEFWQMIQERRRVAAIPWDEARKQLDLAD